jgi:myosin protein heavy chain
MTDKLDKLLHTIDELQASESASQLSARRAERELREEREKSLRLERDLEGWKSLRMEKGPASGPGISKGNVKRIGTWRTGVTVEDEDEASQVDVPKRKSSISRVPSMTKGFL